MFSDIFLVRKCTFYFCTGGNVWRTPFSRKWVLTILPGKACMARSNQSPLTCVCGSNKGGLSHRKTEKDLSCRSALLAQNTTPVRREKRTTHFFVLKSECKKTTLSPASDKQRPRLKCKFHYAGVFSLSFFFGLYVAVDVLWFSLV